MKKQLIISIIGIAICFWLTIFWSVSTANNIVEMKNILNKHEADIQIELQTKFEKLPNLVGIVNSAAQHEKEIIEAITEARIEYKKAFESGDTASMLEADSAIQVAISRFEEEYPEVTTMKLYISLMDEYSGIEAAIAVSRRNYNEVVMQYNNLIESFPTSIVAKNKGFERIPEFKANIEANKFVEIGLN